MRTGIRPWEIAEMLEARQRFDERKIASRRILDAAGSGPRRIEKWILSLFGTAIVCTYLGARLARGCDTPES